MTGVIVRSSANVQSGAATRASTILHGSWILAFLLILPMVLQLVPTASLAGILVVTGWRLVSPAHAVHLHERYGLATAAIWLATMVMVVATDLLTGVLTGLALSLLQVIPHFVRGPLKIEGGASETVQGGAVQAVPELRLSGSATFLQLPHLTDALERTPEGRPVRLAAEDLRHVDHTCLEMIREWAARRARSGSRIEVVGGGRSGLQHSLAMVAHAAPKD